MRLGVLYNTGYYGAGALEYTRWGSIDVTAADVDAHAKVGVNRLVVAPASADLDEQRGQLSDLADRLKLA